ncbi:MAG: NPCBM/NEW2 domain-containing protein [Bacteroidetes bacterium]|nr:NPCBM/NEW2 domain-containing protein [Bacteroidota bacterium]
MERVYGKAIIIGLIHYIISIPSVSYSQEAERSLEAGCEGIATQLSGKLQAKSLKLAVLEISDYSSEESNDKTTELGRILADELVNSLSNRLTIQELYDRKYTQKRLQELGKGSDDLYDPTFAKQFGKSIGVDALIVGTYNIKQVSKTCRLIIKVIDVETGRINATSNTEFFIDDENLSKAFKRKLPVQETSKEVNSPTELKIVEQKKLPIVKVALENLSPYYKEVGHCQYSVNRVCDGSALVIAGRSFDRGIFIHAQADVRWALDKKYQQLSGGVGIKKAEADNSCGDGVQFIFLIDTGNNNWVVIWKSRAHRGGDMAEYFNVDVSHAVNLRIVVDTKSNNMCDWSMVVNPDLVVNQ